MPANIQALADGLCLYKVEGKFATLTLHNDRARLAVFIAGGIGTTPFMNTLRQAANGPLPQRLLLL